MKQLYLLLFLASVPMVAMFEDYTTQKEAEEAYVAPVVTPMSSRHVKKATIQKASSIVPRTEGTKRMAGSSGMRSNAGRVIGQRQEKPQTVLPLTQEEVARIGRESVSNMEKWQEYYRNNN
jgi:hypothetical protein